MRKTIFTFTLIITAILGVQAQTSRSGKLKGSGVIVTETRAARAFNSIKVGRAIEVVMKNDTDGKIIVRADDNVMPFVKTRFEGLELVIGVDKTVSLDNASIQVCLIIRI